MTAATEMKKTINFGKIDLYGRGRKINAVDVEIELSGGQLSICGGIWNGNHSDYDTCGQCLDTIAEYVKDAKFLRILAIWKAWHLNDMHAGTEAQEAELSKHTFPGYPVSHYDWACETLKAAGLYEDNGYQYGTAWLKRDLPQEVIDEVLSW